MDVSVRIEDWEAKIPFRIAGSCINSFRVLVVELDDGVYIGRGEAFPITYLNETPESLYRQIHSIGHRIQEGVSRQSLLSLLPPGGARNAVDSALWDIEAKRSGRTIWELTGIEPKEVTTVFTIGIEDTVEATAARALDASMYPILKVKLDENLPVERVAAIRAVRPDAELVVDANQAWTMEQLTDVAPRLAEFGVKLLEQPLRRGEDQALEVYECPIPLSADESCQHQGELEQAARRYSVVNIKLDKVGGLTGALQLVTAARKKGMELLVSNMGGTSLGMAPAFVLAQLCKYVELDGHLLLKYDRLPRLECLNGRIASLDQRLWG